MRKKTIYAFTLICAAFILSASTATNAQKPRQTATTRQVRTVLARIGTETATFRQLMQRSVDRSGAGNDGGVMDMIANFESTTQTMRSQFNARRAIGDELTDLLNSAAQINTLLIENPMPGRTGSQWVLIRNDLNTLARYYNVGWSWNQTVTRPPTGAYSATEDQVRELIARIENKTNTFKGQISDSLNNSNVDNTNREDSINAYVSSFENATDRLKERFNDRQSTNADATEVLNRGNFIDQFMTRNRMSRAAEAQWLSLRTDLNTLATYYRVSWNWTPQTEVNPINNNNSNNNGRRIDARLTGTYRLNAGQSDNVANVIDNALGNYDTSQRDNVRRGLERRLASPEMIAIQLNGQTVDMASTNSPQINFQANGVAVSETNARGRTVKTTATVNNSGLSISYEGERVNDFYVTFSPGSNGQLKVSRRIYLTDREETITVSSTYDRVSNIAQWTTVNSGNPVGSNNGGTDKFLVPNGTVLAATLQNSVSTRSSQMGDQFTMVVNSPSRYNGAVITGRVSQAANSGRVSGRANISLDFDTITMNGRTYKFGGLIESVTAANGDSVTVNNEGQVRDSNQTNTTVGRAGIGAVIGAIIGAIAGGGQGAAIGAGVGAGAGVGSVLVTGRDSIDLGPGSTFTITSTAPANVDNNRN